MGESRNSFIDWLAKVLAILGFVIALIPSISQFQTLTASPQGLRIASVVGFIICFLSVIWLAFKATGVKARWRWAGLVSLYGITALYCVWVGSWIGTSRRLVVDRKVFPIERASVTSFLYQGVDNPEVGQGRGLLQVTSALSDGEFSTSYKLEYDMPADGDAYAGVSLWFPEPQDLTQYTSVELTIGFGDDQARCRLFIKDSFGGDNSVLLGDGSIVSARLEEQTIQIPLKTYFPYVALSSVREIVLDANNTFVQGKHSFTVSKIRFRK
jgi:hypothetical protein